MPTSMTTPATEGTPKRPKARSGGFDPILTQEQFDKVTARIRKSIEAHYADFEEFKVSHKRLKTIEEAHEVELQKLLVRTEKAEGELLAYRKREQVCEWAKELSAEKGVDASILANLGGTTREQIAAQADVLAPLVKNVRCRFPDKDGKLACYQIVVDLAAT